MKSNWKKYLLYTSFIIVGAGLLYVLIETVKVKNTGFETKTLWDWMELLIIPLVLVIGAFLLNKSERETERKLATERIEEDRRVAEEQREEDRRVAEIHSRLEHEITISHQQEVALQAYFDRMSELLIEKKLRTTNDEEVRDVARARTVSAMRWLNTERNNLVIQFLREAKLITDENSILNGADMHNMDLRELDLRDIYLQKTYLSQANLEGVILSGANMRQASLSDANLQRAFLSELNLTGAILMNANFEEAIIWDVNFTGSLLSSANFKKAHLNNVILENVNLIGTNITPEQIKGVKSFKGATMPDGTIHE